MYHLSIKSISRSDGRSATAAAAYRAGAEIEDLRTGELHSYTRKRDVVKELSEIVLPPGSPSWAEDRSALWNAAEVAEKRKNSRVARDYEMTIPKELTLERGAELVREFAHDISDRYGVAVDYNLHRDDPRTWDGSEKGYQGYHAHVLTTTRTLGPDGFGAKSAMEMSDTQRRALGLGDMATEIEKIRQLWEVTANRHLERAGIDRRIDRRSLKDQGIDREPTIHLGPAVAALERDGLASRMGDFNRQVVAAEKERDTRTSALRELGDEIAVLERPAAAEPVKPKRVRPSRAQTLPKLDFSGLDGFEDMSWEKRQGDLKQKADRELEERVLAQAREKAQDRERQERELRAREERLAPIAWAYKEIEQQALERDERLREALKKAREREDDRNSRLGQLMRSRPEPPHKLLAKFKEKAHQQAVVAWDGAVKLATRLAEKSRRYVDRLEFLSSPDQLKRWAKEVVRKIAPQKVAWYEEDQARKRAEERARRQEEQEKAERQARERAKAEAAAAAERRPAPPRRELAPLFREKSLRQAELERDSVRIDYVLEKAKSQPLTLADKQQLLASWTARGQLHDEGLGVPLTAQERRSVEARRQQANLQVAADMFLNGPRAEALKHYPGLAGHYGLLDEVQRYGERQQGLSALQRAKEFDRSWQQIASSIERAQGMRFRDGKLEVVVHEQAVPPTVVREPQIQPERGQQRDQEPRQR